MQKLIPFLGGEMETSLLKAYNIIYGRDLSGGCLFAQQDESSTRVYFLKRSLYLLNNEELETRFGIKTINCATLNSLSEGQISDMRYHQQVYYSPQSSEDYFDKQAIKNSIDHYASNYSRDLGITQGTSRYLLYLVRIAFTNYKLLEQIYTQEGVKVDIEGFDMDKRSIQSNLKRLAAKDLISYTQDEESKVIIKFNKNALKYDVHLAPKFFETMVY